MKTPRVSSRGYQVVDLIGNHKPFKTSGGLHAEAEPNVVTSGQLEDAEREAFDDAMRNGGGIVYVVYSYATPIAWVRKDGVAHIVDQRFSVTTSKHQGKLYRLAENHRMEGTLK